MKKVFACFLFTLFVTFTFVVTTYGLWGEDETLVSLSITEEEEEEEKPSPSSEEKLEYIASEANDSDAIPLFAPNLRARFCFNYSEYGDVYQQSVYSPPDELLA